MDDNLLLERLNVVTKKCKEISERRAQLEGQMTAILATLKKDYNISTLKEAEDLLTKMGEKLDAKEAKLIKSITELEDIVNNVE